MLVTDWNKQRNESYEEEEEEEEEEIMFYYAWLLSVFVNYVFVSFFSER